MASEAAATKAQHQPLEALTQYVDSQLALTHICVAYSGGMDSHVLLHAAAKLYSTNKHISVRAVYIDHGLQANSAQWAATAQSVCDKLQIPLTVERVQVPDSGQGPEAAARQARYEAFANLLVPGEHLLLAQHAEDQAETFLLQALRGSGPDGLAAIPRKRTFASGYMARPLIICSQEALLNYAREQQLEWIDDPSNEDTRFDRNFLRQEVLPLIRSRWPAASQTLSRSAMRCAAASQTLVSLAKDDLEKVQVLGSGELRISELKNLPRERAFGVIRLWVRQAGYRMPRLQDLLHVMSDLLYASDASHGIVNVREYEFRRYKNRLYLFGGQSKATPYALEWHAPYGDLRINEAGLTLTNAELLQHGLELPKTGVIQIRSRQGGELIKLGDPPFHKSVKKVLQESSVPPWERDTVPLLYIEDSLAAVWNIAVSVDFRSVTEIA